MQLFETMHSEAEGGEPVAGSGGFGPRIALLDRLFSKSNKSRQEKTGGVKGRDRSAEGLERETSEEQITVGRTRRKDGGWHTTDESGGVTWAGQEETSEDKAEMGGLCFDICEEVCVTTCEEVNIHIWGWKILSDETVKKLRAAPRSPLTHVERGRERESLASWYS